MNKRKALIFFAIVCIIMMQSTACAQTTIVSVVYKEYLDTAFPMKRFAYLYTDGITSIYEQNLKSAVPLKRGEVDENTTIFLPNIKYNDQIKIDHIQKKINFFEQLQKNDYYLIEDNYQNHKWDLTKETKLIADYKCYKATTEFRGRKWIVWYTPELNLSAGPWKLYGLPGIILEAYDETRTYTFLAEKITFEKSEVLAGDFTLYRNEKLKTATLQDFLSIQESAREAAYAKLPNNLSSINQNIAN